MQTGNCQIRMLPSPFDLVVGVAAAAAREENVV
jgi:hypothetical protein